MMDSEFYRAMRDHRRERAEIARDRARIEFERAASIALSAGITLKVCSESHYQATNGAWLLNIYPGNRRLYSDKNRPQPPFLQLAGDWTLIHVIKALSAAEGSHRGPA